jgi:hypothetical protein
MKLSWAILLPIMIMRLSGTSGNVQNAKNTGSKEQRLFDADDITVEHPVALPTGALQVLRKDEQVLLSLKAEGKSADELTPMSFLASEIHLDGTRETDLIVIGVGKLRGANVSPFWVFRQSQGYDLVLKVVARGLCVLSTTWNGYRIIEAGSALSSTSYTTQYRFDGKKYRPFKKESSPVQ